MICLIFTLLKSDWTLGIIIQHSVYILAFVLYTVLFSRNTTCHVNMIYCQVFRRTQTLLLVLPIIGNSKPTNGTHSIHVLTEGWLLEWRYKHLTRFLSYKIEGALLQLTCPINRIG